jgi:hypothetical protein
MKYTISYPTPEGSQKTETFNSIPEGAYAALGIHGSRPGDLFICRLAQVGTSLIPLMTAGGKRARTKAKHAGLTKQGNQWIPQ